MQSVFLQKEIKNRFLGCLKHSVCKLSKKSLTTSKNFRSNESTLDR